MIKFLNSVVMLSVLLLVSITSVSIADAQTPTAPDAPVLVEAVIGDELVELVWDVPFNGGAPITHYTVEYSIDNGANWTPIVILSPDNTVIVDNLVNGQEYQFRVSATNAVPLTSTPSNVEFATPATLPGIPLNLDAIRGDTVIELIWSVPSNDGGITIDDGGSPITHYEIEISTDNGATWMVYFDNDISDATSEIITNLNNNQSYVFRVSAVNNIGISFPSDTAFVDGRAFLTIIKHSIGGTDTFEIVNTNSTLPLSVSYPIQTFGFPNGNNNFFPLFLNVVPGELQTVTETPQPGWIQTGEFCSVNGVDIPSNVTSFTPAAGDQVVCKFTNEKTPETTLTITKNHLVVAHLKYKTQTLLELRATFLIHSYLTTTFPHYLLT